MSLIAEARGGRGNGVIVAGAEGIGKEPHRARRRSCARNSTARASSADAARSTARPIYAPFFEIFQQMVTAVNPGRRRCRGDPPPAASTRGQRDRDEAGRAAKYRLYNRIVQSMQDMYGFLSAGERDERHRR